MADQSAQQLFKQAVAAAKQRNLPAARQLIQASIRKDPANPLAWLVYASIAESKRDKLLCLKKTLELDPDNAQAQKMVQEMGVDPAQLIHAGEPSAAPPAEEPSAAPEQPTAPPAPNIFSFGREPAAADPGFVTYEEAVVTPPPDITGDESATDAGTAVAPADGGFETAEPVSNADAPPRPEPRPESFADRVKQSAVEAETIVNAYIAEPPPPEGVEWTKKDQNRAGENEIVLVRIATATGLMTFIGVPLMIISIILWNTPFVQALISGQDTGPFLRTLTPTNTPPTTPTNTPGFTPTSSVTPSPLPADGSAPTPSPTPTVLDFLARGNPDINFVVPTEMSVPGNVDIRAVNDGLVLINEGQYEVAIATLATERELSAFNAQVYYAEALALAQNGELEAALSLLEEGRQERQADARAREDSTADALLNGAFAEVYLALGLSEQARGATGLAAQNFNRAEQNAREAIEILPDWAAPHLALIDSHILRRNYPAALNAIDEAQAVDALRDDVRLIVRRGEVFFAQEDYDAAAYQAFLALWADPISAAAHDLRTRVALAQQNPSLATLYAQTYLYYHPLVVAGWTMLGEARMMEDNVNLAIEAYTQAIVVGENTTQPLAIDAYLARADIYESRGQFAQALADVTAAANATDNPDLRRRQMYLTFEAGQYTEARQLAGDYAEADIITPGESGLIQARALLALQETPTEGDYAEAARLIDANFASIPTELQPLANTVRARAYLAQDNPDTARSHITTAINTGGETAERRFLLGQIEEAQANYAQAVLAYERVLVLDRLVGVPDELVDEAAAGVERATNLLEQQRADATATALAR